MSISEANPIRRAAKRSGPYAPVRVEAKTLRIDMRRKLILDEVRESPRATIGALMQKFGVSSATIRRDLRDLKYLGALQRARGGALHVSLPASGNAIAVPGPDEPARYGDRGLAADGARMAIARAALSYVFDGMSMIIDNAPIPLIMASLLQDRNYSVLAGSISVMRQLLERQNIRVTLPGGELFRAQDLIISPCGDGIVQGFAASRMFMGCQAVTQDGIMENDILGVQVKRALMSRADEVIVLGESALINAPASLAVCKLSNIKRLITDEHITPCAVSWLTDQGVDLQIVEV